MEFSHANEKSAVAVIVVCEHELARMQALVHAICY
jgi:hypothetical protein